MGYDRSHVSAVGRFLSRSAAAAARAGLALACVISYLAFVRPERLAIGLVRRDAPRPVEAVFVFSGDVDFHRTAFAAEVFRTGGARWLVVSGAGIGGDDGARMADAAAAAGVPREAIRVEPAARSTRENVLFTRPILRELAVRTVAVVTSATHSRRAAGAAERAWRGIDVVSVPVPEAADRSPCLARRRAVDGGVDPPADVLAACRAEILREWTKLLGYAARGWL